MAPAPSPSRGDTVTTQELPVTAEKEETRRRRKLVIIVVAAGLVVSGLVAAAAFWLLGGDSSGRYWTEIDAQQPITVDQQALLTRLEESSVPWSAELLTGEEIEEVDWSTSVAIDVPGLSRHRTVVTNLTDDRSVRENGSLLVLGPAYRPLVERVLRQDPQVFADEALEDERSTYRLGGWIAYYSPAGAEHDRTEAVRTYLGEVARCPYDAAPCPGGGE